jgi:hypothetical protein
MQFNSQTLRNGGPAKWLAQAAVPQIAFVDAVYAMCEEHYGAGGDTIVECYTPEEILEEFETLDDVRRFCGLKVEQALNARWGEDDDPEVGRAERFDEW